MKTVKAEDPVNSDTMAEKNEDTIVDVEVKIGLKVLLTLMIITKT